MAIILQGKEARNFYAERLKAKILALPLKLKLVIIQVGEKEESGAYIKSKIKFARGLGVEVEHIKFSELSSEQQIIDRIFLLNDDKNVNGIIVQLPIGENLDKQKIINAIKPEKDVDGLTTLSMVARANAQKSAIFPATARGVVELLDFYQIPIKNKKVAVLGRSILAGAPISEIISREGGHTYVCNSTTPREEEITITKSSDIVIEAIGKPKFITSEFINPLARQVIVDVGINRVSDGGVLKLKEEVPSIKFAGDVDFDEVETLVHAISPVPGGVGLMTVLALFENLYDCTLSQMQNS